MLNRLRRRREPLPPSLPFAERPARAAELEALADEVARIWGRGALSDAFTKHEGDALVYVAAALRVRAQSVRLVGR
jgi:hypothetical protein